ncbi:heavy-metal-associated domain-containing protein [Anaerococcus porci]|uniref:HMA domain-containing protein n=1 Tax=Anaerococcus porci TaxID=2652269 RepID=A0A6N7VW49_9FIRM|nr:cation transporter [Anaerococcus porci]MDY3006524.1 cation transporter [Anaerococcus porci]MSS77909.1 hypothetical protein [Anaerococcus porci]
MKKKYKIENLGCPSCASKMEDKIKKLDGVKDVNISFISQKMKLDLDDGVDIGYILEESSKIIKSIEYDAKLVY